MYSHVATYIVTWSKNVDVHLLPNFTTENVIQHFVHQKKAGGLENKTEKV